MKLTTTIFFIAALLYAGFVNAAGLIIYPAQGQSKEQQKGDEGECYIWARDETGIDPLAQDVTAAPTTYKLSTG